MTERTQTNLNLSPETLRQLAEIMRQTGWTKTTVVTIALDRLYRAYLPERTDPHVALPE